MNGDSMQDILSPVEREVVDNPMAAPLRPIIDALCARVRSAEGAAKTLANGLSQCEIKRLALESRVWEAKVNERRALTVEDLGVLRAVAGRLHVERALASEAVIVNLINRFSAPSRTAPPSAPGSPGTDAGPCSGDRARP